MNKELRKAIEGAIGQHLDESAIGQQVEKALAPYLAVGNKGIIVGPDPSHEALPKGKSFSQLLGDIRRASKGISPKYFEQKDLRLAKTKSSMSEGTDEAGGYMVPTQQSSEVINLLNNYSVLRPLCREVPMRSRTLTIPTVTGGPTAYWVPEASDDFETTDPTTFAQSSGYKPPSVLTLGQLTLTAHVLAVKVPVSNQLLDDSDPGIDKLLYEVFGETIADAFDTAILRGAGAATDPITGLVGRIATNVLSVGADFTWDDVVNLVFAVRENAPKAQEVPVIGHPKAEKMLIKLKNDNGDYLYSGPTGEGKTPRVWGEPLYRDGNILTNLGAGSATRLFAGDFKNAAYVGARMGLVVKANPWTDPGFSHNQTTFLAETRLAFNVASEARFAVLNGVPTE